MTVLLLFDQFLEDLGNGVHNLTVDTVKFAFTDIVPNRNTDAVLADITEIAAGGGYPVGGLTLVTSGWTQTSGIVSLAGSNVTFNATGDVGPFRYLVLYNATVSALIGYYDRGSHLTLHSGDPFVIFYTLSPLVIRMRQYNG